MKQSYLRDQRGVAVVFELVLVAVVLTLTGLAVYQSGHRPKASSVASAPASPSTAVGLAASAAAVSEQASATDASLSAAADSSASELTGTDSDVSNLGGSADASF